MNWNISRDNARFLFALSIIREMWREIFHALILIKLKLSVYGNEKVVRSYLVCLNNNRYSFQKKVDV